MIEDVAKQLAVCKNVLVLTGAGISADSGLPTYRGVGGLYNNKTEDGIPIEEAISGPMMISRPEICWKYLKQIHDACSTAKPNASHFALSSMASKCNMTILTQNIDGFHAAAGSKNVIEIHGNLQELYCTQCGEIQSISFADVTELPPLCCHCKHVVRPRVILYGESLPQDALQRLHTIMMQGVDAVIAVGTSSVFPYISIPMQMVARAGGLTVEINPQETDISYWASYKIRDRAAAILPQLAAML